jgi:hypothetical protein
MKKTVSEQSIFEFLLSTFQEIISLLSLPINTFVDRSTKLSEFLVEKTNIAKYITIFLFILFIIALVLYLHRPS